MQSKGSSSSACLHHVCSINSIALEGDHFDLYQYHIQDYMYTLKPQPIKYILRTHFTVLTVIHRSLSICCSIQGHTL